MTISFLAAAICFIVCHGGPADHFATFAESLPKEAGIVEIHASGPALKKLQERGIEVKTPFFIDNISPEEEDVLAVQIAKACARATVVITDVGHKFDVKIQKALAQHVPGVYRLAYYDNPEPYVPGGYSSIAAEVMEVSQATLFANYNLSHAPIFKAPGKAIDFGKRKKIGIGYYPLHLAEKIAKQRSIEQSTLRQKVWIKNGLTEEGQKLLVYFGGNNEEYFSKAFPAFLSLLEQGMHLSNLENCVVVLQQHPGAKAKNLDGMMLQEWFNKVKGSAKAPKVIISDFNSDDAQIIADGALYFQTSMGPQFVLAGIPTIQVGHETYEDILVKNQLSPSVTKAEQLVHVISDLTDQKQEVPRDVILKGLGIKSNWLKNLEKSFSK